MMGRRVASLLRPQHWTIDELTIACVAGGALLAAHFAKALSDLRPDTVDFSIFYVSVRRWIGGGALYDATSGLINYNPPQFHVLVLPLGFVPLPVAFVGWTLVNAVVATATVLLSMREARDQWTSRERRLLVASVLLAAGVGATVHLGQVSWLVALLVTLGWRAARHDRWVSAGCFTGLAVAFKPFLLVVLLLFIIRDRWRAAAAAIVAALASVAAGGAVFGSTAVMAWLDLLRGGPPPAQVTYFMNASWYAVAERAHIGSQLATAGAVTMVAVTLVVARAQSEDHAWLTALVGMLLASPLGWIYYMPVFAGPLITVAARRQLPGQAWRIWPLLAFPCISRSFLQHPWPVAVTGGSVYFWGLLCLWIATLRSGSREARTERHAATRTS